MDNKERDRNEANKDERKVQEPFDPERTPQPPQVSNPASRINEEDVVEQGKPIKTGEDPGKNEPVQKPKKLGESPTEIDDETTI